MNSERASLLIVVVLSILAGCGQSATSNTEVTDAALGGSEEAERHYAVDPNQVDSVQKHYSPYVDQSFPNRVFWGDTHLHTSFSVDSGLLGNNLGPDEAFRFARGEKVRSSTGAYAQLVRPLDFLVVADHAENLGLSPMISESNPLLLANEWGNMVHTLAKDGDVFGAYTQWIQAIGEGKDPINDDAIARTMWNRIVDSAEKHYKPGVFTTLHGFEWTSAPNLTNLHRVVMFRDGEDEVKDLVPFSGFDSEDPEDLWAWMQAYEERTGGRVMAFPHNGNISNGRMFNDTRFNGEPIDADYARQRMRWEPVIEVTQMKGDGETHPLLSPDDEFADYYTWDRGNFGSELKTPDMLPREYARQALARGLKYEEKLGDNPFKFGVIGATDSHTSLATAREDNNFGKVAIVEPGTGAYRYEAYAVQPGAIGDQIAVQAYETAAAGLAAAWARENTREAIWDAFNRKEVYATTGSRMTVRVFAGWDFDKEVVYQERFAETGYARGVPMGGDLTAAPDNAPLTLIVQALRDPDGANLDRIQVVKGWLDKSGEPRTKVFDASWSGDREPGADGKLPAVGSTVDGAKYTNTIGSPLLVAHWADPEFDAEQRAYYYVRVLEIPTPTWLAYDEAFYGPQNLPDDARMWHQERAYTSPIWYSP